MPILEQTTHISLLLILNFQDAVKLFEARSRIEKLAYELSHNCNYRGIDQRGYDSAETDIVEA